MGTQDIGINAGNIWHLLNEKGGLSVAEIAELTNYQESLICYAIGWLSKEEKIELSSTEDGSVFVELKHTFSDIYY